jgi:NitT/TauT family transport system permease protein
MRQKLAALAFFVVLVALWELAWLYFVQVRQNVRLEYFMPAPHAVASYIIGAIRNGELPVATMVTLRRLVTGYFLGIALGLPLGLLTARFKFCSLTLGTVALGLQTLPSVCWIPLALVWFGGETAMLFVIIMGTIWSVLIATDNGVRTIPPIYVRAARTMGSKRLHTWIYVIFPASLPFIVSGMKQGWAFAWRSLMAAEIYVTVLDAFGLGHLLHFGRENLAMPQVVAIMIVIIVIGLLADRILFSPWEKFLHRRWGTSRE